jgi:hypothetical protein
MQARFYEPATRRIAAPPIALSSCDWRIARAIFENRSEKTVVDNSLPQEYI